MNYPPYDPAPFLKKQKEMSGQAEARRRYDAFRETNSASFASLFRAFAEFYDPECKCIRCECYRLWNNLPLLRSYCDTCSKADEQLMDWSSEAYYDMPLLGEFYD